MYMKKPLLLLLTISVLMFAVLLAFYEKTWECGAKITVGEIQRNGSSLRILNAKIETPGTILDDMYYSPGVPGPFQFNLRGDGKYLFRYSDNVSKIGLWSEQTKVYEGPPIATFSVGKGKLGIDIHAEGSTLIEATSRCSIGSFVKSFF
jgi:hypothetical protein